MLVKIQCLYIQHFTKSRIFCLDYFTGCKHFNGVVTCTIKILKKPYQREKKLLKKGFWDNWSNPWLNFQ
jgi:hypothetical protein